MTCDYQKILLAIAPRGKVAVRAGLAVNMAGCEARAVLNSNMRRAHFLAQVAHESDGFATASEYASGAAYEGRHDLGNTQPGDGRRFKGRGLIQITGRANYRKYGGLLGIDLEANPEQAALFPVAALSAAEFWRATYCNIPADDDDIKRVTKTVNGGANGLASRTVYLERAKHALADTKGALVAGAAREAATATQARKQAAAAGTVAVTTQAGHAAPQAPWWGVAGLGIVIAIGAVVAIRKAMEASGAAAALEQAAKGA